MKSLFLLSALFMVFFLSVYAVDNTYIVALKKSVDDKQIQQAKSDIENAGGNVLYEFKTGTKGFIVKLPDDQFVTMESKDYVDFVEADQEMHI